MDPFGTLTTYVDCGGTVHIRGLNSLNSKGGTYADTIHRNIHQGLRKCVSGPADAFADSVLHLPRGTHASRCIRLILAFGISAFIHAQADLAIGIPFAEAGQFTFFSFQALGIVLESTLQEKCSRAGTDTLFPRGLQKGVGYIWVIYWFYWITPTWSYTTMRTMDPVKDGMVIPAHYVATWFQ